MDGVARLPEVVHQALAHGATILTANQRSARALRNAYDRSQRSLNLTSWQPPAILAWDSWTTSLWQSLLLHGRGSQLLLNRTQELAVWRFVLATDPERNTLRSTDSLAEMAADAWGLLWAHNGQRHLRSLAVSADTRAFQRWALAFERLCREKNYLSSAQLEDALRTTAINHVTLDAEFAMVGFDRMSPAQLALIESLRTAGRTFETLELTTPTESQFCVEAEDQHEELHAAANWIRALLIERPTARVAVIVPKLDSHRTVIDRIFRRILAPELQDIGLSHESSPYEFSLGVPLATTSMVIVALDLLRWATAPLPLERISALLVSPYFAASPTERTARAAFDAFELRRARVLRPEASIEWLFNLAEGSRRRSHLDSLVAALRRTRNAASALSAKREERAYADWAERMRELLEAAQWGAVSGEDSIEFQTRRKWEAALDELATLDFEGARVSFHAALSALERITRQTLFAPESREAPIQIMGPLEAAGGLWDATWFLHAGDLAWPQRSAANPLLPWQLQRDLNMHGTDQAKDSRYAARITQRIANSASSVVFSYAKESAEGHQRPSPILSSLGLEEISASALVTSEEEPVVQLAAFLDNTPLPPTPDAIIHGGANILKAQAACGFRAFAERRLWSTELTDSELGMDAAERGTVVHVVLEHFWNKVRTQDALKAMSAAERKDTLAESIQQGLQKIAALSTTPWDHAYLDMQRERLHALLDPWLRLELDREPFAVKLSEKEFSDAVIGPLHLSVRVDRVDETEGGEILIDYKTGIAKPSDWLSDRPDAPQLPLYAVLSGADHLEAVAFAQIRVGKEMGLHGFATRKGILHSMKQLPAASLEVQVDEWRSVLTKLATAFHNGDARVDPKQYPSTCKHCAQRILCRLDPTSLDRSDLDNDNADEGVELE